MKFCQPHWDQLREAIERKGMIDLVAKSGEEAAARIVEELSQRPTAHDPLMSCHWMIANRALDLGGVYLMMQTPEGGHYCPLCELQKHIQPTEEDRQQCKCEDGFKDIPTCWIESVTDAEREHCIAVGLEVK